MKKIPKKPFILIDGSSYLHRAFHALPPLKTSFGLPTGAVYGVINMIRKLINEYDPKYLAVIFDAKGKTFRHQIFPAYKATRPPMAAELQAQIKPLHDIIRAMGLPLISIEGVEADDIIATLTKQAENEGMFTLISTGDKDMAQLVNKDVYLINTMNNILFDEEAVLKKFAVIPEQIIDYLTLVGDSSDNIPGVPKVGPKTAAKWLGEYKDLDTLLEHAEDVKGKIGENLRATKAQLPLSKQLVTLKDDFDLGVTLEDLMCKNPDNKQLRELFKYLEFRNWLSQLLKEKDEAAPVSASVVLTKEQFTSWLKKLDKVSVFAFDTETTSLDTLDVRLVGMSFALKEGESFYVPIGHDYPDAPKQLELEYVLNLIKPLIEDKNKSKICQNLKYDLGVMDNYGISFAGSNYDTMLESYILNSTSARHDLGTLALKYLGKATTAFEEVTDKDRDFSKVEVEKAARYAEEDADITLQLHETLWPQIVEFSGLQKVFQELEMPLVAVLSRMERIGVCIDADLLAKQSKDLAKRIKELEEKAYKIAGQVFNLGSPKQLQAILFEKLKLPILKKTPKGQASTAEDVLQELALDYPLPKIILEYRSLSKLKSTYTDALPLQINKKTQRVHTSYNQAVTATGRLSSTDPNLQNIPIRTKEGRKIRQAFIAPKNKKIISADYSQIELRIMAHLSEDPGLLAAFHNGHDIHRATAAEVWGIDFDKVTPEQRRRAKAINFGLIYGMSAFGLSRQLGIDRASAKEYMDLYFSRYPKVQGYMENTRINAHKQGFVETIFGRRLYLPEIRATNFQRRSAAERAAINAPMQGTAADIMKLAMIKIDTWIRQAGLDIKMIMQVHDELVFEVAEQDVESAASKIEDFMQNVVDLHVPIVVSIGVGNNWDEAH